MNKETRYNLIFLAIILAILVPGAVVLFRKKLDPDARIMYLPDPVPHAVAYMVPGPTPPGMSRVVPPHTAGWVRQEVEAHVPAGSVRFVDEPLISEGARFQVLAVERDPQRLRAWVLLWEKEPSLSRWWIGEGEGRVEGQVQDQQEVSVPNRVRLELGENGLVRPPKQLPLVELAFRREDDSEGPVLLQGEGREGDIDSVPLFTNSVITPQYKKIP